MSHSSLDRERRCIIGNLLDRAVERDASLGRRAFVGLLARHTGSALVTACGASLLAACGSHGPDAARSLLRTAQRRNETVERWLFRHTAMDHVRANASLAGTMFPAYHVAPTLPTWDAATRGEWSLLVTGEVARPRRFTLAELQALPSITQRVDHFCVEGWNAVARWTGVRMRDLASFVGARPTAAYVDFRSFDVDQPGTYATDAKADPAVAAAEHTAADLRAGRDYHESWDIESALHPQTLIAYGMDGHYLGAAHGAPARVHSPVKLGYKNTKYLTQVVFRTERNGGYWSDQGYAWYAGT
jgi:DMSO/TMAO reductase YedYZ molybdopterin-dependent catalytic subunit